ncbi:MAG: hypothetical protein NTZ49_02295 [Candidatus Parcubacteria bacterium]|nr:hypothetical protein [Candidatus Parcubacteria bacterium]
MSDSVCVCVEMPKSMGRVKAREVRWEIQAPVIKAVQSICDSWVDSQKIAASIANAIPKKTLRRKIAAEEAKPKAYKKPVVVEEKIFLSLPERKREQYYVKLRVAREGVVEVHLHEKQELIDRIKAGHA